MPNPGIFCNSPWYELHIYWDGSLGFCCQESRKLYPAIESHNYNVSNMTIREWYNSVPMQEARRMMFEDKRNTVCSRCYHEEDHSGTGRRVRSNQKSIIFTKENFHDSYQQSPGFDKFENTRLAEGYYDGLPIDVHIDLGNYCNLTCKMCHAGASSKIATQYVKWGIKDAQQYIGSDWTRDQAVWDRVLEELVNIPNLKNIHFMGGETLITKRFEDFVNFMIARKRFDLCFSFVTNGTTFNKSLLGKLKLFQRVGIEVSIETVTEHNTYQRQGTDTPLVLKNLRRYSEYCNDSNITLTVRPAISALTIGYYHTLLRHCIDNGIIVKALLVYRPTFLDSRILPQSVRNLYRQNYVDLLQDYNLTDVDCTVDFNESDPNELPKIIKNQVQQCLNLLDTPVLDNSEDLLKQMVDWCRKWDSVHGYNALTLYPELKDIFIKYGY